MAVAARAHSLREPCQSGRRACRCAHRLLHGRVKARSPNAEAIDNLLEAIEGATALLLSGQGVRRNHPSIYEEMARGGEQWLKVHRYWFGYTVHADEAVIFALIDDTANMPRRR